MQVPSANALEVVVEPVQLSMFIFLLLLIGFVSGFISRGKCE